MVRVISVYSCVLVCAYMFKIFISTRTVNLYVIIACFPHVFACMYTQTPLLRAPP